MATSTATTTQVITKLPSLRRVSSGFTVARNFHLDEETELQHPPAEGIQSDPYSFRRAIKTEGELQELRRKKGGRMLARYHARQNELIHSLLTPMDEITLQAKEAEEESKTPVKIAVWASLLANFCLSVLQIYAAASSASLSLLATGIDSVFDIGSNVMLFWLHKKAEKLDVNKWPVGGNRLETIGNVIYGSLMAAVNLVVIVESVRTLIDHNNSDDTNSFHLPSIIAVAAALGTYLSSCACRTILIGNIAGVKVLLFIYCFSVRKASSQVEILWEDHRNDLFVYSFGILMSAGGSKLRWWLDPAGGFIIALGVILAWTRTSYKEYALLAGKAAPHDFVQLVIYKALTFSHEIDKIDTVRAYHSGPEYFVEVDIVMPGDTPLWKSHDISQAMQDKIEALPGVERCFVHVDHETTHKPEHRKVE
ncbi:CDF manganese transporter [Dacryopinax primogenitus]|uniref:CDF manganese transporter n=1 Tax=Dacryopinax primogenitus (strain DJM 731) TaxID=1858805 RepID=M5GDZ6_DACPD|nr:CDF manganese transporter [Dacryopinax primogenitus]EJU02838.1 CDF manganese transporter [Dacryopinax primogenitus]